MTFAILLGCAWEFDILQCRWNSLALFPVIVWGIHILAFSTEVEEDRKKVELERTKRVLIFSAGRGSLGMLFIRSLSLQK